MNKNRAFTLIELLVVVAIIALLISILLPSLNGARRQAKQAVCLSQLRNQSTASKLYSGENRDVIPSGIMSNDGPAPGDAPTGEGRREYSLPHQVFLPYLGYNPPGDGLKAERMKWDRLFGWTAPGGLNDQMDRLSIAYGTISDYQCPDYRVAVPESGTGASITSNMDYVVNAMPIPYTTDNAQFSRNGLDPADDTTGVPVDSVWYIGARREAEIPRAADFIYIADASELLFETAMQAGTQAGLNGQNFRFSHFFVTTHLPFAAEPRVAQKNRHPGGVNAAFFDGHAETLSPNRIDPGFPNSQALRLQYFTDVSQLPPRFQ